MMRSESRGRVILGILVVIEAALLYVTASPIAARGTLYGCPLQCGPSLRANHLIAALVGVAMFILPIAIGALCRTWQSALALAVAPWLAAVVAHAGSLLGPSNHLGLVDGQYSGPFANPFWIDLDHTTPLLFSLALFILLGWIGWLARQIPSA
jgi:hypothetical protein